MGSFLFFGVNFVLWGVVRSTGAVVPPLIILGLALWGIRLPIAYGLQPWLGADAIWWSFPASALSAMQMSIDYCCWGRWGRGRRPACWRRTTLRRCAQAQHPAPAGQGKAAPMPSPRPGQHRSA